jgi:hypothetical protein
VSAGALILTSTPAWLPLSKVEGSCAVRTFGGYTGPPHVRRDGSELLVDSSQPGQSCGTDWLFLAGRLCDGEWSPAPPPLPAPLTGVAGPLLEDRRTLITIPSDELMYAVRSSTQSGDQSFQPAGPVVTSSSPMTFSYLKPTLSCDGRHLIYQSADCGSSACSHLRIAPIVSLAPVTLGPPETYPLPDLSQTSLIRANMSVIAESPDCSFVLLSAAAAGGGGETVYALRAP